MKTIAIDIDDTLNNFSEALQNMEFKNTFGLEKGLFNKYVNLIKNREFPIGKNIDMDFYVMLNVLHSQAHNSARVKPDAPKFMQWLKRQGWRIIILTYRNLRYAGKYTKNFLVQNKLPCDFLFMTNNKVEFCNKWGIHYLIDDDLPNIIFGKAFGVTVFYPKAKHPEIYDNAVGYQRLDEVKSCLIKSSY